MIGEDARTPVAPPGIFSPTPMQLPIPKFSEKDDVGSTVANTAASSDSPESTPDEDPTLGPTAQDMAELKIPVEPVRQVKVDANLQQQLQERLQELRVLQQQTMAKYLQYAEALSILNGGSMQSAVRSICPSSGQPALLGTQPAPDFQVTQVPSNARNKSERWVGWEDAVVTLIVKELPLYYTQEMFLAEMVDRGFKGHFDLLYIPYSPQRRCNVGYGIVNFKQPEYAMQFHLSFNGECLDEEMSRNGRRLVVQPAPQQGYEPNYNQYANAALLTRSHLSPGSEGNPSEQMQRKVCIQQQDFSYFQEGFAQSVFSDQATFGDFQ